MPDAEVVELPGQAHGALQMAPALVGEVLRRHLAEPGRRTGAPGHAGAT